MKILKGLAKSVLVPPRGSDIRSTLMCMYEVGLDGGCGLAKACAQLKINAELAILHEAERKLYKIP